MTSPYKADAVVEIDGRSYGPGSGTSKKRAEQAAAHLAWSELEGLDDPAVLESDEREPVVLAESGSDR